MNKWFFINTIIVFFAIWKITNGHIGIHTILGGMGLLFILYNWTRHAVFSMIRSNISRRRKIKYARMSKKFGWLHKWFGSFALLLLLSHGAINLHFFGVHLANFKMMSGLLALIMLILTVLFGWLRFFRTTVARRYIHWSLAYTLIFFVIIHLLL